MSVKARKNCVLIGGGDIARRLVPLLLPTHQVWVASRFSAGNSPAAWQQIGAHPLPLDLDQPHSLARLSALAQTFVILAPPKGGHEPRNNRAGDCIGPSVRIRDAGTGHDRRNRALGAHLPIGAQGVYVSTSGVYGDRAGTWLDETARLAPQTARAYARVAAEREIRAWARRRHFRVSIARVPGIYAPDRAKAAARWVLPTEQDIYTNHIHADDLAQIIYRLLWRGRANRVYHAVDDSQMRHGQYARWVAQQQGVAPPEVCPRNELQALLTPLQYSFLSESRRLTNHRIKAELGLRLRYPTVESAAC